MTLLCYYDSFHSSASDCFQSRERQSRFGEEILGVHSWGVRCDWGQSSVQSGQVRRKLEMNLCCHVETVKGYAYIQKYHCKSVIHWNYKAPQQNYNKLPPVTHFIEFFQIKNRNHFTTSLPLWRLWQWFIIRVINKVVDNFWIINSLSKKKNR